jgi:uncharacterized protein (TIGR02246 family)
MVRALCKHSCTFLLTCLAINTVWGQSAPLAAEDVATESVQASFEDYVQAFNRRDVSRLAARWTQQGVFVNETDQTRTVGRDAIARNLANLLDQQPDVTLGGRLDSVRFIRPDVVQVSGQAVTVRPDEEPSESKFTALLVREGEEWLFDSIQETSLPPPAKPYDQLQSLEFLVGHWVDDTGDVRVDTTIRWGANRTFLVRSYTIHREDEQLQQGTQVIGWDPREQRIRCWMFDSDGSFGEGNWLPGDDGWTVKITQTLADGSLAGGTQVITRVDDDTLTVQTVGREVEGESLPATEPVRVVRVRE